ncbi:MAG: hypothetical protein LAN64_14235 [Acidobacteriia bacterium]|nr:hypothetical protein [Terriglobia bacterium]
MQNLSHRRRSYAYRNTHAYRIETAAVIQENHSRDGPRDILNAQLSVHILDFRFEAALRDESPGSPLTTPVTTGVVWRASMQCGQQPVEGPLQSRATCKQLPPGAFQSFFLGTALGISKTGAVLHESSEQRALVRTGECPSWRSESTTSGLVTSTAGLHEFED